jgi:cobalt/nickel transport system permease protein
MIEWLMQYLTLAMHIPDNFLSLPVSAVLWLVTVGGVAWALRRTERALDERQVPLMGVMAACIFAAQMLNFPVAFGTSGHLLGGALAAIVLGPAAGILVMTCVVALQALLFQDGGIVVMGANIFNMGVLTALVGAGVFYMLLPLVGRRRWGVVGAGFVAALLSVIVAALATSLQLVVSGTAQSQLVLPAMLGVHLLIGMGEGLITATALSFLVATRPDVLPSRVADALAGRTRSSSARGVLGVGLVIAITLAVLSPLASSAPDGLERVAENLGFLDTDRGTVVQAPTGVLPDYSVPGLRSEQLSTILAGLIGVVIVAALAYGVALLIRRRATQ